VLHLIDVIKMSNLYNKFLMGFRSTDYRG